MSSLQRAAQIIKEIEPEDLLVLRTLEKALPSHEITPLDYMLKVSHLHKTELNYRLKRLDDFHLISCVSKGAILYAAGLDALALNSLVKRNLISALGPSIGVGKESDVFEVVGEDKTYAAKIFRIGRTSFRDTRRKRSYVPLTKHHHWLKISIAAAKIEYKSLTDLLEKGVSVPKIIARERHILLMKRINGTLLAYCKKLKAPKKTLLSIINNIRLSFLDAGLVNGDLSEYNIICNNSKIWLIDWPQTVPAKHPNASMLLDRDVSNILRFFEKRFGVECHLDSASFYVRGWSDTLNID